MELSTAWEPVSFSSSAISNFLAGTNGPVGRDLRRRARRVLIGARKQVGVDTGDLRKSLYMMHRRGVAGQIEYVVGADNEIATIHHEGARPHIIMAKGSSTLRFSSNGRIVHARFVRHPGTRPNRYLTDNLRTAVI